ncbi:unnamed protein product [Ranitomeya imitator]|uniref:SprT-like domain-containing protein n=1 Tax=Ranitomeya imitator TaxID=111125 RepID=A0ABN9M971_9NEOB|nr:unnamed protein product [Ranitomeya imitator]
MPTGSGALIFKERFNMVMVCLISSTVFPAESFGGGFRRGPAATHFLKRLGENSLKANSHFNFSICVDSLSTRCAGVCSYEGRGGLCSIRLSKPLLVLRPRKDLTLLHEMIHALLFVTDNNKDHDGHGPEFHKHMNRINGLTGAKISVFHSFHDEVEEYRKHWWLCNGPCQKRPPYYGYVKRAMNRAPSKLDPWWADHQRTCGGTGTGYKLGESSSQGSVMVKVHSVPPFSSKALLNSPVKPVQNTSALSSITNKSIHPRPTLPKVSVANTKVFKNINGSPMRLPIKDRNNCKSSGSQLGTLNGLAQKRLSFAVPTSSQGAPSTSQGSSHDKSQNQPPKRPRLDPVSSKSSFPGDHSFREAPVIVLDGASSSNPTSNNQSETVNCRCVEQKS